MRLWLRVAWRILEWPLTAAVLAGPCAALWWWHYVAYEVKSGGGATDASLGRGLLAGIVSFGALVASAVVADAKRSIFSLVATAMNRVVAEERKRMEFERGQDTKDTYLRPVE